MGAVIISQLPCFVLNSFICALQKNVIGIFQGKERDFVGISHIFEKQLYGKKEAKISPSVLPDVKAQHQRNASSTKCYIFLKS